MRKPKPKKYYSPDIFLSQIEKLLRMHGDIDQAEFNRKIEVGQAVTKWKAGQSPSANSLMAIKKVFNISLDWLLAGEEPQTSQSLQPVITIAGTESEIPRDIRVEDYLAVPLVAGLVGAGYEGAIPWDYVNHLVWVYKPEIGRRQWHNLRAIKVDRQANSMTPTIRAGDIVIVDPEERPPQQPLDKKSIYAVRLDDHGNAAIKRVREIEDVWILLSDNLDYNPIMIKKADVPNLIIGKIIWSWTSWVR
jgi:phage repressor protein C with HTH and peptisase S24 domain